jgi:hypothetical protein
MTVTVIVADLTSGDDLGRHSVRRRSRHVTVVGYRCQGNLKAAADMAAKRASEVDEVATPLVMYSRCGSSTVPVDSPRIRELASYAITVDVDADTATPSTAFMGLVRCAREHGPERMPLDAGAGGPRAPCRSGCHATRDPHDGMG